MHLPTPPSLDRRVKARYFWHHARRAVRAAGLEGADLSRVRDAIRVRVGLRDAGYAHEEQQPAMYVRGLEAHPWHDTGCKPWIAQLEAHTDVIRRELLALRDVHSFRPQVNGLVRDGSWNAFYLHSYGGRVDANCRRCPETARLLDPVRGLGTAGLAYFSALTPGAHIAPHFGPTNVRLRCHLGLVVPEGCRMRIGSEQVTWREGEALLIDDSFEHEVWNESARTRLVLIVDSWHPGLSEAERVAFEAVIRVSGYARKLQRLQRDPKAHLSSNTWWS